MAAVAMMKNGSFDLFFPWLILRAFVGGLVLLIIIFRRRSI
jgi:hypothetical protein